MSHYLKKELYDLIKKDESIFDFIQDSSLDGLWYWDLENPENEWMNAKFWTVLGYNPEEMPHKSNAWQNILNQDDLKIALENFTKHSENPNHPYDQIVRYRHKNGSIVWIHCRGLAIRDNNGKPIRMLGTHQDVSNLKNREQELFKANEKVHESERNLQLKNEEYETINEELRQTNDELLAAKEKAEEREEKLRNLSEMQSIILRIASEYINMPQELVDKSINNSLKELGEFVLADRAYVFEYDWIKNVCSNIYEWCYEGVTPEIDNLQNVPNEPMDYWVKTHKNGNEVSIEDIMQLPLDNEVRQLLEPQGVKSVLAIPMMKRDKCIGFIGFDSVRKIHKYSEKEKTY